MHKLSLSGPKTIPLNRCTPFIMWYNFRFKGRVVHSHDYKNSTGFEDKRIVIIGIGNSGGDAAVELSRVASQVYHVKVQYST